MKHLLYLTYKSIQNRKITFILSVISIAISVVLLLGVDKAVKVSKNHFMNTINKTDIIVASSNGSLDILLNFSTSLLAISFDFQLFDLMLKSKYNFTPFAFARINNL